jgi:uncharacterized protein YbjQ (UPF0145 family)
MMVSTSNEIIGFKTVRHLGIVRGITVRSRSIVGNFVGGLQSIFGGQIGAYVDLAESARQEAFDHMCEHAAQAGANAIIGMRYDANEITDGITEVLAYGTAVWAEPAWGMTSKAQPQELGCAYDCFLRSWTCCSARRFGTLLARTLAALVRRKSRGAL